MTRPTFGAGTAKRTEDNVAVPKEKKKYKEVAAVWVKQTKAGDDYLSFRVKIDGKEHNFRAYKNKYKNNDSARPDYVSVVEDK